MTVQTHVIWGRICTLDEQMLISEKVGEMIEKGQTDGTKSEPNPGEFFRTWTNEADAQAWLDFQNTFTPPPESAVIVTE